MGSKLAAKEAVAARNIPMVPGTEGAVSDPAEAKREAERIGFPLLIKASAGGGGKGMRAVHDPVRLEKANCSAPFQRPSGLLATAPCSSSAWCNSRVTLKFKCCATPMGMRCICSSASAASNAVTKRWSKKRPLPCSTTRCVPRWVNVPLKWRVACDYVGAGTVEFLVDASREFFFLEMNTRLQVEHPVTE